MGCVLCSVKHFSFSFIYFYLFTKHIHIYRLDGSEIGPILISIRQFEYSGENLRAIGTLAAIDNKCLQAPLPVSLLNALHREVDTSIALTKLLRVLETVAHIIGGGFGVGGGGGGGNGGKSGGGGGIKPTTKLTDFVLKTLLFNEKEWYSICPRALASHATLSHLKDLLLTVEAKELGRLPTHAVAHKFRDKIDTNDMIELKEALTFVNHSQEQGNTNTNSSGNGQIDGKSSLDMVLSPFRDLLEGPLSDPSDFSPNESLRNFLCYQDIDLELPGTWFNEHFPYGLKLKHALETYLLLASAATSSSTNSDTL